MNNWNRRHIKKIIRQSLHDISEVVYWDLIENRIRKAARTGKRFSMTFEHDIGKSIVKDDELKIASIAYHAGLEIYDESITANKSTYMFRHK